MDEELRGKMVLGCVGAVTPVILNLLIIDAQNLANVNVYGVVGYFARVFALLFCGCVIIYLNSDETKPVKIFQLGLAAPALLTGMMNANIAAEATKAGAAQTKAAAVQQSSGVFFPSFVGTAFAQSGESDSQLADCTRPKTPTATQQFLRGFTGSIPDNNWAVVVSSLATSDVAVREAEAMRRRFSSYSPKVCAPTPDSAGRYRIIIGEHLSYSDAHALRDRAVADGFSKGAWVWNPIASARS